MKARHGRATREVHRDSTMARVDAPDLQFAGADETPQGVTVRPALPEEEGAVVALRRVPDGDWPRERIGIRRDDGQVVYLRWSKRVLVLRQESEADGWLRRQLALLGAR